MLRPYSDNIFLRNLLSSNLETIFPMRLLFITDLDNTLVGDDAATIALNERLLADRSQLCITYSTGRSFASARRLIENRQLLEPDYLITGVGTQIHHQETLDPEWADLLSEGWNRETIATLAAAFPALQPQPDTEQNPWKLSFLLEVATPELVLAALERQFAAANLAAQIVFSSGCDVDILPTGANKGNATAYLRQHLGVSSDLTLVCGDSGNDASLFQQPGRGIIVSNAQPELLDWYHSHGQSHHHLADSPYAWGILAGLKHFGLL